MKVHDSAWPLTVIVPQADAGRDEIRVEAEPVRLGSDLFQVIAQQRFAARKPELDGAERARLVQHTQPIARRQLARMLRKVHGVVAEHALQRTTIGQLEEQPQGRAGRLQAR